MIRYENATFTYPAADTAAIAGATLEFRDGELTLVAGPSGAGKSTLLRMANGLAPHFSGGALHGRVDACGFDTRTVKPRDLAGVVGFVPQDPDGSSVAATVEDEIAFVLENLGMAPALMRKRVEETLDTLSIAHLRLRRLETLSGGERQRVAIAAVLVAAPQMIVLDEPTSQLDPQSAEEVLQAVLRLSHELGIGVVVSEHRLERVAGLADRICIVDGAHAVAGSPREMLATSPVAPPVVRLARAIQRDTVPITVREAREMFGGLPRHAPPARPEPAAGETRVSVRGLRVAIGGREVCSVESLDVRAGETVAIVGRNGAGKTTLLRAIVGLARRARGTVTLDGVARDGVRDAARVCAFVPQDASRILALATARDEVASTLKLKGRDAAEADAVLAEWRLTHVAGRDPRDLSGGESTRLALAAACAAAPGIVLLDEPTRGIDQASKQWLAELLRTWRRDGRAVVVVTHDVELVAEAATRVVMMSDGEIVLDGPTRHVLGESVMFSSQMNKVFGDRAIATVADAIGALQ